MTSFLPTLRHPFQKFRLSLVKRLFGREESEAAKDIREKTLSSLRKTSLIPQSEEASHIKINNV